MTLEDLSNIGQAIAGGPWIPGPRSARQRERFFRAAEAGGHQLVGAEGDDEVCVATVEAQFFAAGDLHCG